MLNLLLIDDEYIILKGVEAMLSHQDEVPVRVTPYIDSVEALQALPKLRPDAVVLDINMPELDGLAFIEQALVQGFSGSFIIISGYEDAAYLKRAFELHVADYIIKPINKQKLIATLLRLHEDKLRTEQSMLAELRQTLKLSEDLSPTRYTAADWQRLFPSPWCALVCLRGAQDADAVNAITQRLGEFFQPVYALHYNLGEAFLLSMPHALRREELLRIAQSCGILEENLPGFSAIMDRDAAINAILQGDGLPLLLEATADSVIRRLGLETKFSGTPTLSFDIARLIMKNADADELVCAYQAVFFSDSSIEKAYARAFVEGVSALLIRHGYQTQPRQLERLFSALRKDVCEASAPCAQMMSLPQQFLQSSEQTEPIPTRYSDKIQESILYLHTHFRYDISLNNVADAVALSPSYLSASFTREVGISLISYLKKIRLDEACRLLKTQPQLSVESIAERVGYQTVGQFYKVFKSVYHESPKSWKDHCLK